MKTDRNISSSPRITALMYHSIEEAVTDPWGISVSPQHFEEQVRFIKSNFNVVSIKEVADAVATGNIINNSVCITFDDGYANNYWYAKPVLEKYNCPAAFFISTNFINTTQPFWWDELEMILLRSKQLPTHLSLSINGVKKEYYFDEEGLSAQQWRQHSNWKWYEAPPTSRCAAFLDIWEALRPLQIEEINKQMGALRIWAGMDADIPASCLPMNKHQLRELAKSDLFTIGLHTHTHADLQGKEKAVQAAEIMRCKNVLFEKYGIESNYLAFPYGRYDDNTIAAVNDIGLAGCFTTEAVSINAHSDLMKLGRYQVGEQTDFSNFLY